MKLIIEDDEGHKTVVPFARDEITIGRQEGNTIRLTERNISRKHARLVRLNGHVLIEDLGSYNGIRVNGEKIAGKAEVADGDLIQIGDYDLAIQAEAERQAAAQQQAAHSRPTIPTLSAVGGAPPEAATEIDAPISSDGEEFEATAPTAQAFEDTSPGDPPPSNPAIRESTSVIRVDQLQSSRANRQVKDVDAAQAPKLVVLNTELAGREFVCVRTELKIGRTEENDIQIEHRSLSRTHCKVSREETGEWKIMDLQSANGIAINGETYAKATLNHGDVIELGHVKLRYVAPGQTYAFKPGDEAPLGRKKLPLPVIAGAAGAVVVVAILAIVLFSGGDDEAPVGRPMPIAQPVTAQPAQEQPQAATDPEPEPIKDPAPAAVPEPAAASAPKYQKELEAARAAIDGRKFEQALPLLEKLKADNDPAPAEVQELLDQAIDELAAKDAIGQAVKQLSAGKPERASELLDRAQTTVAFAEDLEKVRAKVNQAIAAREAREIARANGTVKRTSGTAPAPTATPPKASPQEEARKALEEGTAAFKKKQFREAIAFFNKCLEADASLARCHMMLGSTHAKLKNIEEGARHYRLFVKLSPPDDAEALKVKKFLDEYEASKK